MNNLTIVIAGGNGFIGTELCKWFGHNNRIIILTRGVGNKGNKNISAGQQPNVEYLQWNGKDAGDWVQAINGAHLVINLAGKSVNCRYTEKNKREIFDSRTNATRAIGAAIRAATVPPKLWINAASATIYRHATDRAQDEFTGEYHNDFSVQVCQLWEQTFYEERTPFTRKAALRLAITLGPGGVMLPYFNLLKWGLGGQQGNGKQMYSWVHADDVCRMVEWLYEHKELEGTFNCAAPGPVTNATFMHTLRKVTGHKLGLPAPVILLKMGALLIGTETELLLKSRWVLPTRALQEGFVFRYPQLQEAVAAIVAVVPRRSYHLF